MKRSTPALWLLALSAGCAGPALIGRAQDRNPLFKPPDQVSEGIAIPTKDAQIIGSAGAGVDPAGAPGYAASGVGFTHPTFYQSAIFQAQSARHLTFLIELANRWPELTHAENYDVTLVDDKGHVFRPAGSQGTSAHALFTSMILGRTDVVHMVVQTSTGTHSYTHGEESTNDMKTMMGARTILEFQGADPILTPQTHQLKLSLKHKSRRIEFIWDFRQ